MQACALSAALAGALLLTWTEKRWPEVQEAIIGVSFVLAASGALLLLAANPHGSEHLKELLVGQILWVRPSELTLVAGVYALILPSGSCGAMRSAGPASTSCSRARSRSRCSSSVCTSCSRP